MEEQNYRQASFQIAHLEATRKYEPLDLTKKENQEAVQALKLAQILDPDHL